ncbi:hypothetical protein Hypma_005095 [Hypsizygus marmoreus]|uniref:F-box domain-containing protein n=1 Tax=Hypsizygus marmoreus TaxID=39966 RepID=A0A369K2X2_HYPMA|nr:hypothetical protein Hypma_005095 [Hypsizygus marmoreus]
MTTTTPTTMSSSSNTLPQEILDIIIDEIDDDQETLKCCALSSHSLRSRSQRYIFSEIQIPDVVCFRRLRDILIKNSVLATHIQRVDFSQFPAWVADDSRLLATFRLMTSLETLAIAPATCSSWSTIPQFFRNTANHLRDLPSRMHLRSSTMMHRCTLKMLTQPGAAFSQLRSFSISGINSLPSLPLTIVQASACSIEKIELCDMSLLRSNIEGPWLTFDFTTLPRLQCLAFTSTFFFDTFSDSFDTFSDSFYTSQINLCKFIEANSSIACVKKLQLVYITDAMSNLSIFTNPSYATLWHLVDAVLDRGRSTDTPFDVEVVLKMPAGNNLGLSVLSGLWRGVIGQEMPLTQALGIVVPIGRLDT